MEKIERFVQASNRNLDTMLEYVVSSITRLASYVALNLPTYKLYYTKKFPEIICQATGRLVVPLLPHMYPIPPLVAPPPHIVPRHIIIHPIRPEVEHIHYLVHVVLKEKVVEELPVAKKVSSLVTKPIKMAGVVIPVPVIEKLPAVIPVVEKLPVPVVKNHYGRNTRPGHLPMECEGCEKHPLMSPLIYKMMNGHRMWGDMLYDGVI